MSSKTVISLAFAAGLAAAACETGACYYSCCADPSDDICEASCSDDSKSAETCAVAAQETCESTGGTLDNVEWDEISDLYCNACSDIACAPEWWTEQRLANTYDTSTIDGAADGGA
jgi:hypothetical protein